jgi:hypothetical protein
MGIHYSNAETLSNLEGKINYNSDAERGRKYKYWNARNKEGRLMERQ